MIPLFNAILLTLSPWPHWLKVLGFFAYWILDASLLAAALFGNWRRV